MRVEASIVGAGFALLGLSQAESAPQEAAATVMGVAIAVVPYGFAPAVEGLRGG